MDNQSSKQDQQGQNDPTQKKQNQWDDQNKQNQQSGQNQQGQKTGQNQQQGQKTPQSDWDQNQDKSRKQA
jgi:hypothetical protein